MNEKLVQVLAVLGVTLDDLKAKIAEFLASHPEGDAFQEYLAWGTALFEGALAPAAAAALLAQAWDELRGGTPGYSPSHGGGV